MSKNRKLSIRNVTAWQLSTREVPDYMHPCKCDMSLLGREPRIHLSFVPIATRRTAIIAAATLHDYHAPSYQT